MGHSFLEILHDPLTRQLIGYDDQNWKSPKDFITSVHARLEDILQDPAKHLSILKMGYSALEAFLQSNCTGPPLDFDAQEIVIPPGLSAHAAAVRSELSKSLDVDGSAVYSLIPNIELFWLARACLTVAAIAEAGFNGRRARFRVLFIHQKLLLEKSDTLRELIYVDAAVLETQLSSRLTYHGAAAEEHFVEFLVERAAVRTYYGDDHLAREDLLRAAKTRNFQFALTGALGKRTKFQERDISQLVVLAKSRDREPEPYSSRKSSRAEGSDSRSSAHNEQGAVQSSMAPLSPATEIKAQTHRPEDIPLNDDTLLEAIHFKQMPQSDADLSTVSPTSDLPRRLASLDPAQQPLLNPMDSIILLAVASAVSTSAPSDSLTREETLPYATRVLEGGSSNWQVYTQALLVRSRIEGYRSRTAERGLLQLQALVDQVIAETTSPTSPSSEHAHTVRNTDDGPRENPPSITITPSSQPPSTFLPKPTPTESAPVAERLRYVYQLSPPLRWELESELASRWVTMGGLKTALEIFDRLQMHAEAALCLAGTDQEAEAVARIRRLLFEDEQEDGKSDGDKEKDPLPPDAPRLFCILGDIVASSQDPNSDEKAQRYYNRAWTVSNARYARAQRSLGRWFAQRKRYPEAAGAYRKALAISRLNSATWFALGAVQLELQDWKGAVVSFGRCVRDGGEEDAMAWSNLAVALLKGGGDEEEEEVETTTETIRDDQVEKEDESIVNSLAELDLDIPPQAPAVQQSTNLEPFPTFPPTGSKKYKSNQAALTVLQQAVRLSPLDSRIWDNYLTAASSIPPPRTPWSLIIHAQRQIITLRSARDGERCVDLKILSALVDHVVSSSPGARPDLGKTVAGLVVDLLESAIVPLITTRQELWWLTAEVRRWRGQDPQALEAAEKAWRVLIQRLQDDDDHHDGGGGKENWDAAVDGTVRLVGWYRDILVAGGKWKFKAKSAVRAVMGKGKDRWEDSPGWTRLEDVLREI